LQDDTRVVDTKEQDHDDGCGPVRRYSVANRPAAVRPSGEQPGRASWTATREFERDREAAKASLATASSILQSEIERHSCAKGARPGALAAWQIARVRAFIDENLHRTIQAKDLSAVAQRSTAHFSRSFKQAFGEPPHAYVVGRRLERACHLMITSSASLSEIALSVGFSDNAHLGRLFRRVFGQSPSSWRRDLGIRRG
jgi:AraC-like DNA-binding protein